MLFWTKRFTLYLWYWTQQHCYKKQNFEELPKSTELPRLPKLKSQAKPSCSFVSLVVKGVLRWRLGLKEIGEFPEREVRNSPVAVRLFTNDCSCYTHMVVKNRLKLCEYLFTAWVRLATPGPQPPQS